MQILRFYLARQNLRSPIEYPSLFTCLFSGSSRGLFLCCTTSCELVGMLLVDTGRSVWPLGGLRVRVSSTAARVPDGQYKILYYNDDNKGRWVWCCSTWCKLNVFVKLNSCCKLNSFHKAIFLSRYSVNVFFPTFPTMVHRQSVKR